MPDFPIITGATPIDDVSGLKLPIHTWDELIVAEAHNIAKAVSKYLGAKPSKRTAPFDVEWLFKLHNEMFGEVWDWAGNIRTTQFNIGVAAYQIREELHKLMDDLQHWQKIEIPLMEQTTRLHHRSVQIHPFINGNGRWARMLANIWLKQHDSQPTVWPADVVKESPIRADYIAALKEADQGNIELLVGLHKKYTH